MLTEIVSGVLVNAISSTSRWILAEASMPRGGRSKQDAEIATWFDTYRLSDTRPDMEALPEGLTEDRLIETIEANVVQACLHELLAVRITYSPEISADEVKDCFSATLRSLNPDVEMASISNSLIDYYDAEICTLSARLRGGQPDLYQKIRTGAYNARLAAILASMRTHYSSIGEQQNYLSEAQYLINYRRHVCEYHGKLQPPDFDRRQRVPVDQIYVSPTIIPYAEMARRRQHKEPTDPPGITPISLDDATGTAPKQLSLDELTDGIDRTVLLGDPGGGKSTAANVIMYRCSMRQVGRVPFLVTLREYASADGGPSRSIVAHIEHKLTTLYQCAPPANLIARLCLSGNALIIFDGLDELIDTSRRIEITEAVEHFCTEFPLTRVLVTSRVVGYNEARLDPTQFVSYRLAGFSSKQVAEYVRKWFAQDESLSDEESDQWADSFLTESVGVPDLLSNPLMLALMCILYLGEGSIPRNRPEVYEQCADLLFRKWDMRRRISVEVRAHSLIEPALRHLAYWLFTRQEAQPTVTENELIRETSTFFRSRGYESDEEAAESAKQFVEFCRGRAWVFSDAGTTAAGEILYTFTHRTFLEYFAGAHVAIACDTAEDLGKALLPHVAKAEWEVVAELALQKKDQISDRGAERAMAEMLREKRRRSPRGRSNVLQFLARCVAWIDVPRTLLGDLADKILDHFSSGDPNDPTYYLPLANLCSAPLERCELILSQILGWSETKLGSEDETERSLALRICVFLDVASFVPPRVVDDRTAEFWRAASVHERAEHADLIRASISDEGMLLLALAEGLVGISEVLDSLDGNVVTLFTGWPVGIFAVSWGGYLPYLVWRAIAGEDAHRGVALEDLRAVGAYLDARPSLPWYVGGEGDVAGFLYQPLDEIAIPEFDELTNLGLTAITCTVMELAGTRATDSVWIQVVPGLKSYVERRWSGESTATADVLPDLPIPPKFASLLRNWALRAVNFCDLVFTQGDDLEHSQADDLPPT